MGKFDKQIVEEKKKLCPWYKPSEVNPYAESVYQLGFVVPRNAKKGSPLIVQTGVWDIPVFTVIEWETGFLVMLTEEALLQKARLKRILKGCPKVKKRKVKCAYRLRGMNSFKKEGELSV